MNSIRKQLEEQRVYYQNIIAKAQHSLKHAPKEGHLRVANRKGVPQYYHITEPGDVKGTYIPKSNLEPARQLAQRDYDKQVISLSTQYIRLINQFINHFPKTNLIQLQQKCPGRQVLITPYEKTDEEYLKEWESVKYKGKIISDDLPKIFTEKGERVRSKSEKMIADKLYALNIPYRYEYPFHLNGFGVVYPDFTLLHMRKRKEIILEHFGIMDNPEYCSTAILKLNQYAQNGLFLGDNLLITCETSSSPLDTRIFEKMLMHVFYQSNEGN